MSIEINCPCGQQTRVKSKFAGRTVLCPACKKPLKVPGASDEADEEQDQETAEVGQQLPGSKAPGSRKYLVMAVIALVAFAVGWSTGHFGLFLEHSPTAQNPGANHMPDTNGKTQTAATITADPNPVPKGPDKLGKTTISWDTGDKTIGEVYLLVEGKPERRFAGDRPKGSQEAPWIGNKKYEFRLYAGKEQKNVLASVIVTREK